MFDEVVRKVKAAGFSIKDIITDKDSSTNAIFCRHFPEGTITYCSNHCAKNLHKDLDKIKKNKCEVINILYFPSEHTTECMCNKTYGGSDLATKRYLQASEAILPE